MEKKALALKNENRMTTLGWVAGSLEFQVNWSTDLNLSRLVLTRNFEKQLVVWVSNCEIRLKM